MATAQPEWALGLADEVRWSRLSPPQLQAWAQGKPLRLQQRTPPQADPDPQAIAGDGLLGADTPEVRVRWVAGRPGSPVTTAFLGGVCERFTAEGKKALLLGWDPASGHRRQEVRDWLEAPHRHPKPAGGVRLGVCQRPLKSRWLNRLEPYWLQAKRAVAEPGCRLSEAELIRRIGADFHGQDVEPLQQGSEPRRLFRRRVGLSQAARADAGSSSSASTSAGGR